MDAGKAAGEAAAAAMSAFREQDGFLVPFTPTIGTGAGEWRPLGWPSSPVYDPDPWVRNLKPFLIKSPSQFRADEPPALTSAAYTEDFNEVKRARGAGQLVRARTTRQRPRCSGSSPPSRSGTRWRVTSRAVSGSTEPTRLGFTRR